MVEYPSIVHALVALGLSRFDAWRWVHQSSACGLGPVAAEQIVLVHFDSAETLSPFDALRQFSAWQVRAVADQGAAWRDDGNGNWQYLRRLAFGASQIIALHDDVTELAAARPTSAGRAHG